MAKVETENTKQNELLNKIYKTEKEIKFCETILEGNPRNKAKLRAWEDFIILNDRISCCDVCSFHPWGEELGSIYALNANRIIDKHNNVIDIDYRTECPKEKKIKIDNITKKYIKEFSKLVLIEPKLFTSLIIKQLDK